MQDCVCGVDLFAVTGSCKEPQITLTTKNSGLVVDPTSTILGDPSSDAITWTCSSTGLDVDTPRRCRN